MNDSGSSPLLAFCHIEKAAGTSLIHVLRRIFLLRYADVRPMHGRGSSFTARDLKTMKAINPFLRAFGGHSVVPSEALLDGASDLAFITQLRDPVARAVSQYRDWIKRGVEIAGPEAFLERQAARNFQVKKLAGSEDLEMAKRKLRSHFVLAGTVEQFDEFLVLLARELSISLRKVTYARRNVNAGAKRLQMPDSFIERLKELNQLDQELYDWVSTELFQEYVTRYGDGFSSDLEQFRLLQSRKPESQAWPLADFIYRKAWIDAASGSVRVVNGLPYRGSY